MELIGCVSIFTGDARLMDTLIMSKLFLFSSCCTGIMTGFEEGMKLDTFITSFAEI